MNRKRFLLCLGAVALTGVFLRLAVCICLANTPAVRAPLAVTDMATYLRLAKEICAGNWPDHFDYQPFYYTVFLPFCRLFSGDSPWGYMLMQTLLGGLSVFFIGLAAAQVFRNRVTGLLAAAMLAVSKMHIFTTPFALFETVQSFWMALLLFLSIQCYRRNRLWLWATTALVFALATLTRGNILLFFPFFLLLYFYKNRILRSLPVALALLLLFELPQLPYSLRNAQYCGRWTGASTAGEKVLALGNTPEAPPGGLEYPLTYHKWVEQAERKENRVPVSREILRWLAREPILFANLQWEKLLLFWNAEEIPNNVSLENEGKAAPWLVCLLPFGLLAPLALFAFFSLTKKPTTEEMILLCATLLFWLATALFYNLERFRIAILPLLACSAAQGIQTIIRLVREKTSRKQWLSPIFRLCCAIFLVHGIFPFWQENVQPALFHWLRPDGTQIVFSDTVLVHDHGPMTVGGVRIFLSDQDTRLRKELVLPAHGETSATVRLATIPPYRGGVRVVCEGKEHPVKYRPDIGYGWLEAEIPLAEATNSSSLQLEWLLPQNTPYALDTLRNYGRTEGIQAEAVVQVQYCPIQGK